MHHQCPQCKHDCFRNDCLIILSEALDQNLYSDIKADLILCKCGQWYKSFVRPVNSDDRAD